MRARPFLFRLHSWLGLGIGFVLAVMGLSGATLAFQDEIKTSLSPGVVTLPADSRPALAPAELIARASAQRGGLPVIFLVLPLEPKLSARVFFVPARGNPASPAPSYVEPHTGQLLGPATGEPFFDFCESLHRWLALPGGQQGIGGTVTGIAAICMLFFTISGLYLRWPRRPLDWRQWLLLQRRGSGSFGWSRALHVFAGTWVLAVYLFSASTGLWFAFGWYQQMLGRALGAPIEAPPAAATSHAPADPAWLETAWRSFRLDAGSSYDTVMMRLPLSGEPLRISGLLAGPSHGAQMDEYLFDSSNGGLLHVDRWATRTAGGVMAKSPVYVHIGSIFGLPGRMLFVLAALTLPLFPVTGLLMYRARRR